MVLLLKCPCGRSATGGIRTLTPTVEQQALNLSCMPFHHGDYGTDGGIRTHTVRVLSAPPLPSWATSVLVDDLRIERSTSALSERSGNRPVVVLRIFFSETSICAQEPRVRGARWRACAGRAGSLRGLLLLVPIVICACQVFWSSAWCERLDSNQHFTGFEAAASATLGYARELVRGEGIEPT
jgi:hypothetical protein